jgi:Ca-activated chloride channel family protein
VREVPEDFRLGLVGFGSTADQLVEPTTDRARLRAAVEGLQVSGATAMGDGLSLGLDAARTPVPDGLGGSRRLPAAIVLLSDGASTRGADPIDIAERARRLRIPVYAVALGTAGGTLQTKDGRQEPVPPDPLTLREIARETHGRFFATADAGRLASIYESLGTRLSKVNEKQEVTSAFAGGGLVLLLAGAALGLLRSGRLP